MFKTLIKIRLQSLKSSMFGRMNKSGKELTGIKKVLFGLLIVYVVAVFSVMLFVLFSQLIEPFSAVGIEWLYFAFAGIATLGLSIVSGIFMANSQIFEAKDNELLLSMPIKPSAILASRVAVIAVINFAYTAVIMLCAEVVYVLHSGFSVKQVLLSVTVTLLQPLLSTAIACLCGWIIGLALMRSTRKNIVTTVLLMAFFIGYMYFAMNMQGVVTKLISNGANIAQALESAVPPLYYFGLAALGTSVSAALKFAAWCVVPFAVCAVALSLTFTKIATAKRGEAKVKYKEKPLKSTSARMALTKKEFRRFLSMPMYIFNSGIGAVLMIALAVAILVKGGEVISMFTGVAATGELLPGIIAAVMCFLALMTTTSSVSISLEGKSFSIIRSSPITAEDFFFSKIAVNVIVGCPSVLICALACWYAVPMSWGARAMVLVVPMLAQLLSAFWGLTANLLFPRLDWTNPTLLIKQSGSAMLAVFGGMGVVILPIVAYTTVLKFIPMVSFMAVTALFFAALCAALCVYIMTTGKRKLEEI